jgi:hypothetical protein
MTCDSGDGTSDRNDEGESYHESEGYHEGEGYREGEGAAYEGERADEG